MKDVLKPEPGLLVKIGSALIHAQEFLEPGGHLLDRNTFLALMKQPDVKEWIAEMNALALLPRKRSTDTIEHKPQKAVRTRKNAKRR